MKLFWRINATLLLLGFMLLTTGSKAVAAVDVNDFYIHSLHSDYYLTRTAAHDANLEVDEKIVAVFPEIDQNHGILRSLPTTYKDHSLRLRILKVTDDQGHSLPYSTSTQSDNKVLKIGDAHTFVHGQQEYDISYTMQNVITHYADHDELYWDVNGTDWSQPFDTVSAHLHLDRDIAQALQPDKLACFTGYFDDKTHDCTIQKKTASDGSADVDIEALSPLGPFATLTYVTGFQPQTFAAFHRSGAEWGRLVGLVAAIGGPPTIVFGVMLRSWWRKGRDAPGRGTIVPQYLPPKEVSVLSSGLILKQKFLPNMFSAQVVDLAVRHYLKIYEVQSEKARLPEYEVELVKDPSDLRGEEQEVLRIMYDRRLVVGQRINLSKLTFKLGKEAVELGKSQGKQLAADNYFRSPPDKAGKPYLVWGGIFFLLGIAVTGFFGESVWNGTGTGLGVAGVIMTLGARFMPARAQKGREVYEYLLGLKEYIKLAEADRLKVLQSPTGQLTQKVAVGDRTQLITLYERLLPYAMLFGLEREWAKVLAPLYTVQPDWYVGSTAFNALVFANQMENFSSVASNSFTSPTASSGSGFGGGGFAGGGGGGGGGGGW